MLGIILRLGAMATLGVMFALVKLANQNGIHLVETLFWRQLAGLPVVIAWLWWMGRLRDIRTREPLAHGLRSTLGLISMALNFSAMMLLPMAEATTISFATPVFATLLAALLLGEPTGRYRWGAVALGFVGVMLAMQPRMIATHGLGPWVALAGAMLTACVLIQIRRMSQTENAGAIVFWFSLSSLLPLGIAMPFFAKAHDAAGWSIIAGLALSGAVAQILLTSAMRHASVAAIATMDYSGLIWSILFGYLIFDQLPGPGTWLGAPVIIAAGMIIIWRERYLARHRVRSV
ncbi:MAG: DMT family transporter [Sphingomonadaceae bacterium]|nr:DMT family transporter [Sphingomonadaceae bacterium]